MGFKHCAVHRYSIATMLHVTAEPRGKPVASSMYFFGELYVHIYYYMLNNTFYIKLLCMHDAMTCNIVAIL